MILLLQLYKIGFEVGRYISIERIIEENKERYYGTLEQSSSRWHESNNDIWPYGNFLLSILKEAYKQLDQRIESSSPTKGNKTDMILDCIQKKSNPFQVAEIKYELPGVGIELIRKVLKKLQKENKVACLGRGRNAMWEVNHL